MPSTRAGLVALVMAAWVATAAAVEPAAPLAPVDDRATLGKGLSLAHGLWIGADVTFGLDVPKGADPASVELGDVSLLARWEPLPWLSFFGEVRGEDMLEVAEGGEVLSEPAFVVERLWGEVALTPSLSLRIGQSFTPFGLWNQTRRAPHAWTIEEPAVVDETFPIRATGMSLLYRTTWHGWTLDGTAYGPIQDAFHLGNTPMRGWLVGTRLAAGHALGSAFATVGLNAAAFRPFHDRQWTTMVGLDAEVTAGSHQVLAEASVRTPVGGGRTLHGFYVQDAVPLTPLAPDLFGIVRFEYLRPDDAGYGIGGLVGLFWRPRPWLVLRTDYLFANRTLDQLNPGLHATVSLLF